MFSVIKIQIIQIIIYKNGFLGLHLCRPMLALTLKPVSDVLKKQKVKCIDN